MLRVQGLDRESRVILSICDVGVPPCAVRTRNAFLICNEAEPSPVNRCVLAVGPPAPTFAPLVVRMPTRTVEAVNDATSRPASCA